MITDDPTYVIVFLGQPQVKLPTVLMHWLVPQGLAGSLHSSLSTHWLKYRCSWNPCNIFNYTRDSIHLMFEMLDEL